MQREREGQIRPCQPDLSDFSCAVFFTAAFFFHVMSHYGKHGCHVRERFVFSLQETLHVQKMLFLLLARSHLADTQKWRSELTCTGRG